jgi:glycerol-3-phosphate dehydrogenase (NAD(P)+)
LTKNDASTQQSARAHDADALSRAERVTIVGEGQMGLVLAAMLAERGVPVCVWGPFPAVIEELARTRRSPRMPGLVIAPAVRFEHDGARALADATLVVSAIPTQFVRAAWQPIAAHLANDVPVVSVTKGIEDETLLRPSQVIADAARMAHGERPVAVLSGPTIAAELAMRLPATMVSASTDAALAERVQRTFSLPWLRIYTNSDVVGVEIAGAAKNVVAIAAGMVDGLGLGSNAKSALLARGLAEIVRLGSALGDLATTCFSPEGRNRSCGEAIGRGEGLAEYLARTDSVVEGVATSHALLALADRHGVDMPIVRAVESILFHGTTPAHAIRDLMGREAGAERVG